MYAVWIMMTSAVAISVVWQLWRLRVALASRHWPSAQSQFLDVRISEERESEGGSYFYPTVRYRYQIGDVHYESTRLSYGWCWMWNYGEVVDELSGMLAGQLGTAYYDPNHPKRSVLIRGPGRCDLVMLSLSIFASAVFGAGIVRMLLGLAT